MFCDKPKISNEIISKKTLALQKGMGPVHNNKMNVKNRKRGLEAIRVVTEVGVKESTRGSTSLQCYSVLSTIAQVLRKMSLKILASCFLMPKSSQTFELYQRVRIYTYSVNDLGLKKFVQKYGIYGHFTVCR